MSSELSVDWSDIGLPPAGGLPLQRSARRSSPHRSASSLDWQTHLLGTNWRASFQTPTTSPGGLATTSASMNSKNNERRNSARPATQRLSQSGAAGDCIFTG